MTVTRYRVEYRRADGHNSRASMCRIPFDGAVTATIPAGGTGTVGFELVRHVRRRNRRSCSSRASPNIISTIADVTFFGTDQVGNDVSATGSILINFANFGD